MLAITLSWEEPKPSDVFAVSRPPRPGPAALPGSPARSSTRCAAPAPALRHRRAAHQVAPPSPSAQLVFTEVGFGAVVLTFNVILLGGDIVFFQALCLLGYCLFPICVSSIICAAISNKASACLGQGAQA
jgi:hypothetical protein